jgi:hypothetical protein
MKVENTLAYYGTARIIVLKSFLVQSLGANVIRLFTAVIYKFCKKLERLSLASLSSLV